MAFLEHQHGALAGAERGKLLRHQRVGRIEDENRKPAGAALADEAHDRKRAHQVVEQPTLHDQPDVVDVAFQAFVDVVIDDVAPRGRQPFLDL